MPRSFGVALRFRSVALPVTVSELGVGPFHRRGSPPLLWLLERGGCGPHVNAALLTWATGRIQAPTPRGVPSSRGSPRYLSGFHNARRYDFGPIVDRRTSGITT